MNSNSSWSEDHSDARWDAESDGDQSGFVPVGRSDLTRLRSGEIDQDEYLHQLVRRSTAHLEGALSSNRLSDMREVLLRELQETPAMKSLFQELNSQP
ncbi:MAG: hypothetical protein MK135_06015 [Polyangiaceae bacterium]|nr:hypothetical protein [Polyangiaceae bacterium]